MFGTQSWRAFQAVLILLTFFDPVGARARKEASADASGELEKIAKTYKIEIVKADLSFPVKTTHGMINGKSAGEKVLQDYARLFAPEFALYPTDLIQRSQLKRVVLCSDLSFADQRRNAIPDYEHDTLYLDVSRGTYSKAYLRKVIHHEFFHIIDYRDDGSVYKDERWEALNPAKFKYGSGGRTAQDLQQSSVLTDKFPGFLNHYSTTAVEEDKAEVFANLIIDSEYVENRAKKDRVLNAKVERMKELLVTFCPEVNDKFWEKAAKVKRAEK
jgi:Putative zinc-binding metallo-peptidase